MDGYAGDARNLFTPVAFHADGIQDRAGGRCRVVRYLYRLYIVFDCLIKIGGWDWCDNIIKRSFIATKIKGNNLFFLKTNILFLSLIVILLTKNVTNHFY